MTKEIKRLVERAIEVSEALDSVKPLYKELDAITEALRDAGSTSFDTPQACVIVKDNFADRNTVFKTAGVRRFELEIVRKGSLKGKAA